MKDYRLSEIKDICENRIDCPLCQCRNFCAEADDTSPSQWDVEMRDMIELPCKVRLKLDKSTVVWQIVSRAEDNGISTRIFINESRADEYLAELKGDKE